MPHIIAYARASHAEYRVGIEKLVPFREHMGDERVEPIFLDFEMDVGGPHRAAVRGREHFSNSAVEIGRAHVCTPVTNEHLVCRLLLETKNNNKHNISKKCIVTQR